MEATPNEFYYHYYYQEEARHAQLDVLRGAAEGSSEEEVRRLLAQYEDDVYSVVAKLEDQRGSQRDALLAKLAARRRMKEELSKENAVASELNRITTAQVKVPVGIIESVLV